MSRLWLQESLRVFVLGVSLGHPDMSPPEDGGNPRHATQLLAQMPGHWAGGDTELEGEEETQVQRMPCWAEEVQRLLH